MRLLILQFLLGFFIDNAYAIATDFWDNSKIRKGANIFNQEILKENICAAKFYKIQFIRLAPDKFFSKQRDFLIGNADNYQQLVKEDLKYLKNILNLFYEEHMPVVITMLSLPGSRWKQNNNNKDDVRLWSQYKFQQQAIKFWQDLASNLKHHPAIIGYNILNEPHTAPNMNKNLNKFYQDVIKAIRKVDLYTPVILDSNNYADPKSFEQLVAFISDNNKDNNILYSFHMYEPYAYTNFKINQGNFIYPGEVQSTFWDKTELHNYLKSVINVQKKYNISSSKIIVGEFGGNRKSKGLDLYFRDLIEIFNEHKWHFAFYAFREDTWDGMNYEVGTQKQAFKVLHDSLVEQ